MKTVVVLATALLLMPLGILPASACACCSHVAQRTVEVEKIDAAKAHELARFTFRKEAKLLLGEAYDDDTIKGLDDPSEDFTLAVSRGKDRMSFALRDEKGRSGTLSLIDARTISIFEVDTRDDTVETNAGPRLYKEWKLTAKVAGDGIFRQSVGPQRRITLVLHGRGNGCTTAADFKHWTLLVHGTGTRTYSFYGELAPLPAE